MRVISAAAGFGFREVTDGETAVSKITLSMAPSLALRPLKRLQRKGRMMPEPGQQEKGRWCPVKRKIAALKASVAPRAGALLRQKLLLCPRNCPKRLRAGERYCSENRYGAHCAKSWDVQNKLRDKKAGECRNIAYAGEVT
jgi:hypothetical protein